VLNEEGSSYKEEGGTGKRDKNGSGENRCETEKNVQREKNLISLTGEGDQVDFLGKRTVPRSWGNAPRHEKGTHRFSEGGAAKDPCQQGR